MSEEAAELTANPLVVVQATEAGATLLHMSTGDCFELNEVGREVWRMLGEKATTAEIVAALATQYSVPHETVESDVRALVAELIRHGLLTPPQR